MCTQYGPLDLGRLSDENRAARESAVHLRPLKVGNGDEHVLLQLLKHLQQEPKHKRLS